VSQDIDKKAILEDVNASLKRKDLFVLRRDYRNSFLDYSDKFPLLVDFFSAPVKSEVDPNKLNKLMMNLIPESLSFARTEINETRLERMADGNLMEKLYFGYMKYLDFPMHEQIINTKRIIVRDKSLMLLKENDEHFKFLLRGFNERGGVLEREVVEENEYDIKREIRIFIYPCQKIAKIAFLRKLDPSSYIDTKKLMRYLK
jgi:hypothetical protein